MKDRTPKPIKRPRRLGEQAGAVIDFLSKNGVTGAKFYKTKHARVEFVFQGRELIFRFSCTPTDSTAESHRVTRGLADLMGIPR